MRRKPCARPPSKRPAAFKSDSDSDSDSNTPFLDPTPVSAGGDVEGVESRAGRVVAPTQRASRAARPPSPSEAAKKRAWQTATATTERLERDLGLKRIARVQPRMWKVASRMATRSGNAPKRKLVDGSAAQQQQQQQQQQQRFGPEPESEPRNASKRPMPHILSLHSRSIDTSNREV